MENRKIKIIIILALAFFVLAGIFTYLIFFSGGKDDSENKMKSDDSASMQQDDSVIPVPADFKTDEPSDIQPEYPDGVIPMPADFKPGESSDPQPESMPEPENVEAE